MASQWRHLSSIHIRAPSLMIVVLHLDNDHAWNCAS